MIKHQCKSAWLLGVYYIPIYHTLMQKNINIWHLTIFQKFWIFFPLFELNKLSHYVKLKQSAKFHSQPHTALHECIIIIEKGIPVIFDATGLIPKAYARPCNTCTRLGGLHECIGLLLHQVPCTCNISVLRTMVVSGFLSTLSNYSRWHSFTKLHQSIS